MTNIAWFLYLRWWEKDCVYLLEIYFDLELLIKTDNKLRQSGKLNIKKIVYKLSKKFKIKSNINQYFDKNKITRFI